MLSSDNEWERIFPLTKAKDRTMLIHLRDAYRNGIPLIFGNNEIEETKKIESVTILNNEEALNIMELTGLILKASYVVANDTGPAHLSIALGTPTVVILGGGHFGSFFPYPENLIPNHVRFVYENMPCYHCFWRCFLHAVFEMLKQ